MLRRDEEQVYSDLLKYYAAQVSAHVGPVISIFFSIIGMLVIIQGSQSLVSRVFFSILYFVLCVYGAYFYGRLMYFGRLVEETLQRSDSSFIHNQLRETVMRRSRILRAVAKVSEAEETGYRLTWAWIGLGCAGIGALLSWIVIFFRF